MGEYKMIDTVVRIDSSSVADLPEPNFYITCVNIYVNIAWEKPPLSIAS